MYLTTTTPHDDTMSVDTTTQYSSGILIGNWNEDRFGSQHATNLGIQATPTSYDSVQKASYRLDSADTVNAYLEAKNSRKTHQVNARAPNERSSKIEKNIVKEGMEMGRAYPRPACPAPDIHATHQHTHHSGCFGGGSFGSQGSRT